MKSKNYILVRAAVTLLLTLLSSTGAWADDAKIIVWLNDGNKSEVLFADMPELTYADGYVSITSNSPSTTCTVSVRTLTAASLPSPLYGRKTARKVCSR